MQATMNQTAAPKISVKNLDFYYGKFHALKNINLEIPEKKVTAFIGPSGCGKSTLLNGIAGLIEVAEGSIEIGGQDMTQADPSLRGIGMLPTSGMPG